MSTLNVTALKHESAGVDNLVLDSSGNTIMPYGSSLAFNSPTNQYISADANNLYLGTGNLYRLKVDTAGRVTMPYQPAFSAHNGGANSSGAIVFATTLYNNGSHYSTSTGRFTAPVTGMYYFNTQHLANPNAFDMSFNKNGTRLLGHAESNEATYKSVSNAQVIYMNAGDYVYVEVWSGSTYGLNYCMFTGHLIG